MYTEQEQKTGGKSEKTICLENNGTSEDKRMQLSLIEDLTVRSAVRAHWGESWTGALSLVLLLQTEDCKNQRLNILPQWGMTKREYRGNVGEKEQSNTTVDQHKEITHTVQRQKHRSTLGQGETFLYLFTSPSHWCQHTLMDHALLQKTSNPSHPKSGQRCRATAFVNAINLIDAVQHWQTMHIRIKRAPHCSPTLPESS